MPRSEIPVLFSSSVRGLSRPAIRDFYLRLRNEVTAGRDFACLITGDRTLRRLNRDFLHKDYATDVLSFPSEVPAASAAFLGDVAISARRAAEQAARFGHSVDDEIRILMLHGVLHLMGLDHDAPADRGAMARTEKRWRRRLALPVALIERTRSRP
jgi:probable rRNA maturation factor